MNEEKIFDVSIGKVEEFGELIGSKVKKKGYKFLSIACVVLAIIFFGFFSFFKAIWNGFTKK